MVDTMSEPTEPDLLLDRLHETHPGICEAVSGTICGAAAVCLLRHGNPPTLLSILVDEDPTRRQLQWTIPSTVTRNSHRNTNDATRDGAYALALLSVQRRMGIVAISRSEQGTGADWYMAPPGCGLSNDGEPNLEDPAMRRLEVGGRDHESWRTVLDEKVEQIRSGLSEIPGIAAAVIFAEALVAIRNVLDESRSV